MVIGFFSRSTCQSAFSLEEGKTCVSVPGNMVDQVNRFLPCRFYKIPRGHIGEYDPAEIHNCGMLKKHLIGVSMHLAWQMLGFFIFLYG